MLYHLSYSRYPTAPCNSIATLQSNVLGTPLIRKGFPRVHGSHDDTV